MQFYASWYPGDPIYSQYDQSSSMLISVTSVPRNWKIQTLTPLPTHIMIDSGGFHYATTQSRPPSPKEIFQQQVAMIGTSDHRITLCALDHPTLSNYLSSTARDRAIYRTIANAYEFKKLRSDLINETQIEQLAIVQGNDVASLRRCANELKKIGFDRYGIGSMAQLYRPEEIIVRIDAVSDVLGQGVHVFGVSDVRLMNKMINAGAESIDSTTVVTSAKYNIILYSNPFRRFIIADSITGRDPNRGGKRIKEPLQCDCPVCRVGQSSELLEHGTKRNVYLRSLHNYWHLAHTIRDLQSQKTD